MHQNSVEQKYLLFTVLSAKQSDKGLFKQVCGVAKTVSKWIGIREKLHFKVQTCDHQPISKLTMLVAWASAGSRCNSTEK